MPEEKVTLESGDYPWDLGGRYQLPSDPAAGLPPGWLVAPEDAASMPESPAPRAAPTPSEPAKSEPTKEQELSDRMTAREFLHVAEEKTLPSERVNLDTGTAAFMGYEVPLTTDSIASIKMILAMEVCRILELERERILITMQQQEMQTAPADGGTNVPEVPRTKNTVEPKKSRRRRKVQ